MPKQEFAWHLPPGWGAAIVTASRRGVYHAGVRSYDHAGMQLKWRPPPAACRFAACDFERQDCGSSFMAQRLGVPPARFPLAWVTFEVMAKIADVPILLWLRSSSGAVTPEFGAREIALPPGLRANRVRLLAISRGLHVAAFAYAF